MFDPQPGFAPRHTGISLFPFDTSRVKVLEKVAGRCDIEWHANTTFDIAFPLFHMEDDKIIHHGEAPGHALPFRPEDFENTVCGLVVKEDEWSDNKYDDDAVLKVNGTPWVQRDAVTGRIISAGLRFSASDWDMHIEPDTYYFSVDLGWPKDPDHLIGEFDKVDKVVRGKFKVLPNTINYLTEFEPIPKESPYISDVNITSPKKTIDPILKERLADTKWDGHTSIIDFQVDVSQDLLDRIANIEEAITNIEEAITNINNKLDAWSPYIQEIINVYQNAPSTEWNNTLRILLDAATRIHDIAGVLGNISDGKGLAIGNINHQSGPNDDWGIFTRPKGNFAQTVHPDLRSHE